MCKNRRSQLQQTSVQTLSNPEPKNQQHSDASCIVEDLKDRRKKNWQAKCDKQVHSCLFACYLLLFDYSTGILATNSLLVCYNKWTIKFSFLL